MNKGRFGVVRNGEHVFPLHDTREQALADIVTRKGNDLVLELTGWINDASHVVYWVELIKTREW